VTSGLDALLKVWDTLPGHRRRARTLALPLVHGCASALYDLIVAPGLASNARRAAARAQRARLRARDNTRRELV